MYPYNTDVVNVSHSEYPQHVKELYSLYDLISDAKLLIYPLMAKHSNNNIGTIKYIFGTIHNNNITEDLPI